MSVAKFTQPNSTTQDATTYKNAIESSIMVMSNLAAMFAPRESNTPAMTITIEAGALMVDGSRVVQAAQTSGTITAPATGYLRIDRAVIDATTGVLSIVTGTPHASAPSAPAIPSGKLPVAQIALTASTTAITNSAITDERTSFGGSSSARATIAVHTSSGTWTKQAGLKYVKIDQCGGGGGVETDDTGCRAGAGGRVIKIIQAADLGSTESIVIGAAGNSSTSEGAVTSGGATSFGSHAIAGGGGGRASSGNGNAGTATGGDLNFPGPTGVVASFPVIFIGGVPYGKGAISSDLSIGFIDRDPYQGVMIIEEFY